MTSIKKIEKNKTILILASCYFFVFGFSNVSYFLSLYYSRTGAITPRDAGLIVSVFYIVSVAARPFLAHVLSVLGFKKLFASAGVMFVASAVCMASWGLSFWPALLSRAFLGLASSLYKIGFSTYQALAFGADERGRAYSLIMAGELMPLLTIAPVAESLIRGGRYELYMIVAVLMSIASFVVVSLVPKLEMHERAGAVTAKFANPFRGMGYCLGLPAFRLALMSTFFFSTADAAASFMSPMASSFGLMASTFLSSNALVGVGIRLFFSGAIDRFPRRIVASVAALLTSLSIFAASTMPSEASFTVLGFVFGLGMGFGFPAHLALIADSVPRFRQAQASAIMWFVIGSNFSLVPLLMGSFESHAGAAPTFRAIALFALLGSSATCILQIPRGNAAANLEEGK